MASEVFNLAISLTLKDVASDGLDRIEAKMRSAGKEGKKLAKSIFRLGFEVLRNCFCQITTNIRQKQQFKQLTLLLSCIQQSKLKLL